LQYFAGGGCIQRQDEDAGRRELGAPRAADQVHQSRRIDVSRRLRAYRQIANAATPDARERVEKELEDRYSPVPGRVRNLLEYSTLNTAAEKLGVQAIDRRQRLLNVKFHRETQALQMGRAQLAAN
jgi:transcription-repair coupling factor (superfamily II helicase)